MKFTKMNLSLFILCCSLSAIFLCNSVCWARPNQKTVSECSKDLSRSVFALGDKKSEQLCRKYSQETIDCAIEDYRFRSLGRTFDDAIEDCDRQKEN